MMPLKDYFFVFPNVTNSFELIFERFFQVEQVKESLPGSVYN